MTSKLKALGDCSSHHYQGTYCGGPITGRTPCLSCLKTRNFVLIGETILTFQVIKKRKQYFIIVAR